MHQGISSFFTDRHRRTCYSILSGAARPSSIYKLAGRGREGGSGSCYLQWAMLWPHTPELVDMYELVEEILIHIPSDEPVGLIRTSLVCKAWCRLLSGHGFRDRY